MERIYVTVRAKPLSLEDAKSAPWRISDNSISLINQSTKFDFDRIFGEHCKTEEVYEARTKEIVASTVRGFNGIVKQEFERYDHEYQFLREKLALSEEQTKQEIQLSLSNSAEIAQLRSEIAEFEIHIAKQEEMIKLERETLSLGVSRLQAEIEVLMGEKNMLSNQLREKNTAEDLSRELENLLLKVTKERDDLLQKNVEAELIKKRYANLDVSGNHKEKLKLRMRLRSTQAKLDMYRGRYTEAVGEMSVMNRKYEEASAKLKDQLALYGTEILRLKKELSTVS